MEISNLIQLIRSSTTTAGSGSGSDEYLLLLESESDDDVGVWDDVAEKMGCLGFERSASEDYQQIFGNKRVVSQIERPRFEHWS